MESPYSFKAVIFDLDGVITKTALVHAAAWKETFDAYLRLREKRDGEAFVEFTHHDYLQFVDGKPRYNGVRSFLKSRGIAIPMGEPTDPPDKETCSGLGNKKNEVFRKVLQEKGVELYPTTVDLVKKLRERNIRVGVASSSKNCQMILQRAGVEDLFETRIDGVVSVEMGLKGKPEGDIFVVAARNLDALPFKSVVVEDAKSGVQAGRNGAFGLVLGVAREKNAAKLMRNGADMVVRDLADISIDDIETWFQKKPKPLFEVWQAHENDAPPPKRRRRKKNEPIMISPKQFSSPQAALMPQDKRPVFFINYDGTLTTIKEHRDQAVISDETRQALYALSRKHTVAILSARQREDIERLIGIEDLFYIGSWGFDIAAPGFCMVHPKAKRISPLIEQLCESLGRTIGTIPGVSIESKKYNIGIHYRLAPADAVPGIKDELEKIVENHADLRLAPSGKKAFELLPNVGWGKGSAICWIMKTIKCAWSKASVVYIGDDITDEFAFRTIRTRGIGIVVDEEIKPSAAHFRLSHPDDVLKLLQMIVERTA